MTTKQVTSYLVVVHLSSGLHFTESGNSYIHSYAYIHSVAQ